MPSNASDAAWMLDENVAVADDGGVIAGIPGLWRPGVAVHPDAFGMSVDRFRLLVDGLDLPLVEVPVDDSTIRAFDRSDEEGRLPSEDVRVAMGSDVASAPSAPPIAADVVDAPVREVEPALAKPEEKS